MAKTEEKKKFLSLSFQHKNCNYRGKSDEGNHEEQN
jgi:hypothetical protein